jgi:hypothetical protein
MTPTRSSRRYAALKGKTQLAAQIDKPMIPMAPEANKAVRAYPFPTTGKPNTYDLVLQSRFGPDTGTTLPN